MNALHTPGPWHWDGDRLCPVNPDPRTSSVHSILDAEGGYGFLGSDTRATLAELEADRRLIAAAPELLAALRVLLDREFTFFSGKAIGNSRSMTMDEIAAARSAIAKATA